MDLSRLAFALGQKKPSKTERARFRSFLGSVKHMRRVAGIFSVLSPLFVILKQRKGRNEAEIGSCDFHSGEITGGLSKEEEKLEYSNKFYGRRLLMTQTSTRNFKMVSKL